MKHAVDERLGGHAPVGVHWESAAEHGDSSNMMAFFLSLNGPPEELAMLARALLKAGGSMPLLPAGEAHITPVTEVKLGTATAKLHRSFSRAAVQFTMTRIGDSRTLCAGVLTRNRDPSGATSKFSTSGSTRKSGTGTPTSSGGPDRKSVV